MDQIKRGTLQAETFYEQVGGEPTFRRLVAAFYRGVAGDPELRAMNARHKKFRANRSMRDVEPSVNLLLRTLDDHEIEGDQE